ncbi:uncharacterized protein LOC135401267 [Ornithodoros turicata]|uniref:uncharacterized protein LOC135401267 n=1 Tax=Ornithodoros turicata TaxID=34597 RepID=UPI00313900BD
MNAVAAPSSEQPPQQKQGCYLFFRLQSRPSIQALGALCFICNALLLLLLFFILINPEEATMYMKLSIIRTNVKEMTLAPVPFVVTTCISIMVDLFLVVGIEDNCPQALTTFINWGSLCMGFELVAWIGIIIVKVNKVNSGFFILPTVILVSLMFFKVYTVKHLSSYRDSIVKSPATGGASVSN